MQDEKKLLEAIKVYGEAYKRLEELQPKPKPKKKSEILKWEKEQKEKEILIPRGDQKSGCIGEFYARLYLRDTHKGCKISFGGHSQKGWDIEVLNGSETIKFQVKTITRYSQTQRMGALKSEGDWDKLIVVVLDKDFSPKGFYVASPNIEGVDNFSEIPKENEGLVFDKQLTCKFNWKTLNVEDSPYIQYGDNLIGKLNALLEDSE